MAMLAFEDAAGGDPAELELDPPDPEGEDAPPAALGVEPAEAVVVEDAAADDDPAPAPDPPPGEARLENAVATSEEDR
jgi:hypothetical protein